jgi:hypothetical protein
MKKLLYILLACVLLFTACEDTYLDLDPQDSITEAAYYTTADHFKAGSNYLYFGLAGWRTIWDGEVYMDYGTDLTGYPQDIGRGYDVIPAVDDYWTDTYSRIRKINILLEKAEEYTGDQSEIAEYVAVAKFFRAYQHFFLLMRFGGVPIVTEVPDISSEVLTAARSSRYEVFYQVLTDLDAAITNLPLEENLATADKGKISKQAAYAFKAKVLLYEGTWENNVGTTTDGDGVSSGAGSTKPSGYPTTSEMIQTSYNIASMFVGSGTYGSSYSIWNHNDDLDNISNCYLFDLEDAGSNPGGYEKASNNEFILYSKYDYDLYQANNIVSHVMTGRGAPSRKMMDLFLCTDGKTTFDSELFEGYETCETEYHNRDYRMMSYFVTYGEWETPAAGTMKLSGGVGWTNRKFYSYNYGTYRAAGEEGFDYPVIRLAEMYLIYAETAYYLNGSLTDQQMAESINLIKERAGLPGLTNAFLTENGMDIYEEIMRERAVELYLEFGNRYNDLKRLAIAEESLNDDICGPIVEGNEFEDNLDLYDPATYPYGTKQIDTPMGSLGAIIIDPVSIRDFQRKHYLFPLPSDELGLNENLLQNPSY